MAVSEYRVSKEEKVGISFTDRLGMASTANGTPGSHSTVSFLAEVHASHCAIFPDPLD